jgi:hypothetical protein
MWQMPMSRSRRKPETAVADTIAIVRHMNLNEIASTLSKTEGGRLALPMPPGHPGSPAKQLHPAGGFGQPVPVPLSYI